MSRRANRSATNRGSGASRMDYGQEKITWRGHTFNRRSVAALLEAERRLGYQFQMLQGSYNTSVAASAGTHAGGGAVDCVGRGRWPHEVQVLREVGWVAWHRTPPAFSTEHIHGVLRGDPQLADGARQQIVDWEHGLDGLADHLHDPGPSVDIPVFPLRIVPPPPGGIAPRQLPAIDLSNVQGGFRRGMNGPPAKAVQRVQRALNARMGTQLDVDGLAGDITRGAYRDWQKHMGRTDAQADGMPDFSSLAALGTRRWRVVP